MYVYTTFEQIVNQSVTETNLSTFWLCQFECDYIPKLVKK